jgi:hypothetical protein
MSCLIRLFTEHPNSVGESYIEHACFAWKLSCRLARCSIVAFVHGCFPCCFQTSASDEIELIHDNLKNRDHEE